MPIDPGAVGATGDPVKRSWTKKDCLLYSLGVGCGVDDLQFSTEKDQRVLPTMAVILGGGGAPFQKIGSFNPAMLVHGEEGIELFDEIPPEGTIESKGRVAAIWDKGKGAVVEMESESTLVATGKPLLKTRMSAFIRGEGGFGGERGPSAKFEAPSRAPDHEVTYETRADQALLYRLSGDRNPLHSDPSFAKMGGFDTPILHGLCSFGMVCKAVVDTALGGDTTKVTRYQARFAGVVFPGETIVTSLWREGDKILVSAKAKERDTPVITNSAITISA